jgi:hypothetical protein
MHQSTQNIGPKIRRKFTIFMSYLRTTLNHCEQGFIKPTLSSQEQWSASILIDHLLFCACFQQNLYCIYIRMKKKRRGRCEQRGVRERTCITSTLSAQQASCRAVYPLRPWAFMFVRGSFRSTSTTSSQLLRLAICSGDMPLQSCQSRRLVKKTGKYKRRHRNDIYQFVRICIVPQKHFRHLTPPFPATVEEREQGFTPLCCALARSNNELVKV